MIRGFVANLGVSVLYCLLLLFNIYITDRVGHGSAFGRVYWASLPIAFAAFFVINRVRFAAITNNRSRLILIAILSAALTAIVGYFGLVCAVNIYRTLGGRL